MNSLINLFDNTPRNSFKTDSEEANRRRCQTMRLTSHHPFSTQRLCVFDVSSYIKYDVVQPSLILLISSLMRLRLTVFEWVYMAHIQIYAHSRSLLLIIFVCKEIERECEQSSLLCVVRFASVYSDTYRTANGLCAEYLNAKWV